MLQVFGRRKSKVKAFWPRERQNKQLTFQARIVGGGVAALEINCRVYVQIAEKRTKINPKMVKTTRRAKMRPKFWISLGATKTINNVFSANKVSF
jgi:hypothetical protein